MRKKDKCPAENAITFKFRDADERNEITKREGWIKQYFIIQQIAKKNKTI